MSHLSCVFSSLSPELKWECLKYLGTEDLKTVKLVDKNCKGVAAAVLQQRSASKAVEADVPRDLPAGYSLRLKRAMDCLAINLTKGGVNLRDKKIRKWLFRHATQVLYRECDFSKKDMPVLILGVVSDDGMGDYYHMLHAAEVVQKAFPHAMITLGAEVAKLSQRCNKFLPTPFQTVLWGYSHRTYNRLSYENQKTDEPERKRCIQIAKIATLILDISHMAFQNTVIYEYPKLPNQRIVEYGANTRWPRWQFRDNSMGVSPFELGLIWKTPQNKEEGVITLSEEWLKSLLLDPDLLPAECANPNIGYHQTHLLHFAYMHGDNSHFVRICLATDKFNDKPVIDIILPRDLNFANEGEAQEYFQWIREDAVCSGIKEIHTFQKKSGEEAAIYKSEKLQDAGKTLRLINPFPIPNNDMRKLMAFSSPPIGCTGNISFSEVLSDELIPYYHQRAYHDATFFESFVKLAEDFFRSTDSPLVQYLTSLKSYTEPERIAELLSDKRLSEEMHLFCDFIKQYYNFNDVLIDIVNRIVALGHLPVIKEQEKELFADYEGGKKSLVDCYARLRDCIHTEASSRTGS